MDDDDIGTVRWFGESWGAPMNDPRTQVLPPVWENCIECQGPITTGDRGVILNSGTVFYHLECFWRNLGID